LLLLALVGCTSQKVAVDKGVALESLEHRRFRVKKVLERLKTEFPDAHCALHHNSPLQLLIATILSAQCTDKRVNMVTPALFEKYPTAADFAQAPLPELEEMIRSTGFYRNKARNIQQCCRALVEHHNGEVPQTMAELTALAGVGRKTANVVLGDAFHKPEGIVVDTHVTRITNLLKLVDHPKNAVKIEQDLMKIVPQEDWVYFSHAMILHGRKTCIARRPQCTTCPLNDLCPSRQDHKC